MGNKYVKNSKDFFNEKDIKKQIEELREEEKCELKKKFPNIDLSGKIDKKIFKTEKELKIYNTIYYKYDKLITPLLSKL